MPNVTNQPLSEARKVISAAQLTVGNIDNSTHVVDETKLIVSWQSLTAGTQVDIQSRMDLRVTSPDLTVGLSNLQVYNCSPAALPVRMWTFDRWTGLWNKAGDLAPQYGGFGTCPYSGTMPLQVSFANLSYYYVIAVQVGRGCTGNEVEDWPWSADVLGNPKGGSASLVISTSTN